MPMQQRTFWPTNAFGLAIAFAIGAAASRALTALPNNVDGALGGLLLGSMKPSAQAYVGVLALVSATLAAFLVSQVVSLRKFSFASRPAAGVRERKADLRARDTAVTSVRDGLEKQLADLVGTVSRYLDTTSKQAADYASVNERLASANTVEKVQALVEILIETNSRGHREVQDLRSHLKDAHVQVRTLKKRLEDTTLLATLDGLTSLPNRRAFENFIENAVFEAHADFLPLAVIMADLDHFKRVNDNFGHATGDSVLKQFGKAISASVRSGDFVARYGGEEFVIVLKKTPLGSALEVAERVRANISSASWRDASGRKDIGKVTASFGVAEIKDGEPAEELVDRADKKLYLAKRNGRNRVEADASHR